MTETIEENENLSKVIIAYKVSEGIWMVAWFVFMVTILVDPTSNFEHASEFRELHLVSILHFTGLASVLYALDRGTDKAIFILAFSAIGTDIGSVLYSHLHLAPENAYRTTMIVLYWASLVLSVLGFSLVLINAIWFVPKKKQYVSIQDEPLLPQEASASQIQISHRLRKK